MRYAKERQRRRWPRAAITHRAQGDCGLIQCQNSSPMLSHRNRHPFLSEPRKTPARDPLYFLNSLLVRVPAGELATGHRGESELIGPLDDNHLSRIDPRPNDGTCSVGRTER